MRDTVTLEEAVRSGLENQEFFDVEVELNVTSATAYITPGADMPPPSLSGAIEALASELGYSEYHVRADCDHGAQVYEVSVSSYPELERN